MEWQENALILGTRKHGETSLILEVMTVEHGRHLGLVRGGRSRAMQPTLQAGNKVSVTWRARLEDHLGIFTVDPIKLRAARLMESALGLQGVQTLAALLRLLPEREPHRGLAEAAEILIDNLDNAEISAALLVRFEMAILEELGFGLDLTACAATGATQELVYVSPKSGRAVSRAAGEPYHDKMLTLPAFVSGVSSEMKAHEVAPAFALTSFFLHRHIYEPRGITQPASRNGFERELIKAIKQQEDEGA